MKSIDISYTCFDKMERRHTDALVLMVHCNMFEDTSPVRPCKMCLDASSRQDIHSLLCMLELLQHDNECRTCIPFLVDTRAMVVELNHSILVLLSHLVRDPSEPFKGSLFSRHPVKVGPLCHERSLLCLSTALRLCACNISPLLNVVKHILHNANQRGGSNA